MPSAKKPSALVKKGWAMQNKKGKLVIANKGFKRLIEHYGFSPEYFEEAAKRLSKYPYFQRIGWHGGPYVAARYIPIYAFLLKKFSKAGFLGKKILELGPGATTFMEELASQGAIVKGLDIHELPKKPGITAEAGSAENLDKHFKGEKFDAVYSLGLFHPGGGIKPIDELEIARIRLNKTKDGRRRNAIKKRMLELEEDLAQVLEKAGSKLNKGGLFVVYGMYFVIPQAGFFSPKVLEKAGFRVYMSPKPFSERFSIMVLAKK